MGYLDPPPARQVPVEMELLLQLQGLVACVCSPGSLPFRSRKFLQKREKGLIDFFFPPSFKVQNIFFPSIFRIFQIEICEQISGKS